VQFAIARRIALHNRSSCAHVKDQVAAVAQLSFCYVLLNPIDRWRDISEALAKRLHWNLAADFF
tara:strand:+ start:269 stop:460 length:192 start_codon:yes stop_codon:yes gene_type:complete